MNSSFFSPEDEAEGGKRERDRERERERRKIIWAQAESIIVFPQNIRTDGNKRGEKFNDKSRRRFPDFEAP